VDKGLKSEEKLCLLIERGSFWGMGYLPVNIHISSSSDLKAYLDPYADNDTIRNSIYSFIERNPEKRMDLLK
jgi:DNA polymerase-3 subunit epsilon